MNNGKVGAPFQYSDRHVQFLAFLKIGFKIPHRMVQGIVRGLSEYVKIVEEIHFTHIRRRMIRIKPSIGIERIIVGIRSTSLKRSSRLISIGIGVGIVVYFGSGHFYPDFVSKLYVLILGFGLLATGALRIIDGIKNSTYERPSKLFTQGTGVICVAVALLIFMHPEFGFILLLLTVSIVILITGIQIAFVGMTGKKMPRLRS